MTRWMSRTFEALALVPLLTACAENLPASGRKVDLLFVIDNSSSMQEEAAQLARQLNLAGMDEAAQIEAQWQRWREDAKEAGFVSLLQDGAGLDYQLGITTTSVMFAGGDTSGIDRGEAGWLVGDVIGRGLEADLKFQQQLLCEATCWNTTTLASDPAFTCPADGTPPVLGDAVSREYLDCLCGVDAWRGHCGAGQEMGIEAGLLGLCRAAENPPAACSEFPDNAPIGFTDADRGSNAGFLREDASTIVVIVSDEGDDSPRKDGVGDSDVQPYLDIFAEFANPVRFAVIGPAWKDGDGSCLSGAQPWAVERYQNLARETEGVYIDLTDMGADCAGTDFGSALSEILPSLR